MIGPETAQQAWKARFGTSGPTLVSEFKPFLGHRTVRRYLDIPISIPVMQGLIGVAQSAATSSHLQLVSVVSVQEPEARKQISEAVGNQQQVVDAAWFLAWIVDHSRIKASAARRNLTTETSDFQDFFVASLIDAGLMAERLVCAAEAIGIGSCYIGGLRNDLPRIKDILGLPDGTFGAFGLCLGYPDPAELPPIRPRLAPEDFWFQEKYKTGVDTAELDGRMASAYAQVGLDAAVTYTQRSARRLSDGYLSGREGNKAFAESEGFARR